MHLLAVCLTDHLTAVSLTFLVCGIRIPSSTWQGHGEDYIHNVLSFWFIVPTNSSSSPSLLQKEYCLVRPCWGFPGRQNHWTSEFRRLTMICSRSSVFSGSSLASKVMDGHLSGIVPWSISHKVSNYFVRSIDQIHWICPNSFIVRARTGDVQFLSPCYIVSSSGFGVICSSVEKARSGQWKLPSPTLKEKGLFWLSA